MSWRNAGVRLEEVCCTFQVLWEQQRRSQRLALPFLKTAQRLLNLDVEDKEHPLNSALSGRF